MVKRDDANVNSFLRAAGLNLKPTRSEEALKRNELKIGRAHV